MELNNLERRSTRRQRATDRQRSTSPNPQNRFGENRERGQLRGGARFAARNAPYYSSLRELLAHHQRLLDVAPAVATRYASVAGGTLLQTTARFRADHQSIRQDLLRIFADLFRQSDHQPGSGFEVAVTFNAVLASRDERSFSLFFGQDYRNTSESGTHSGLTFGRPTQVENLLQIHRIPHEFDLEQLLREHRNSFETSDVFVYRFINIVYLIYQYRENNGSRVT